MDKYAGGSKCQSDILVARLNLTCGFDKSVEFRIDLCKESIVSLSDNRGVFLQGFCELSLDVTFNKPHSTRDQGTRLTQVGNSMRLYTVLHLESMLQAAKEAIRVRKFTSFLLSDELSI